MKSQIGSTDADKMPSLGSNSDFIIRNFLRLSQEYLGYRIVEAEIVGGERFRCRGKGRLGVVVEEAFLRDATQAEKLEFEEAVELGQVEIYTTPLVVSGRKMERTVLHRATGWPIDPNSVAAQKQRERWARSA